LEVWENSRLLAASRASRALQDRKTGMLKKAERELEVLAKLAAPPRVDPDPPRPAVGAALSPQGEVVEDVLRAARVRDARSRGARPRSISTARGGAAVRSQPSARGFSRPRAVVARSGSRQSGFRGRQQAASQSRKGRIRHRNRGGRGRGGRGRSGRNRPVSKSRSRSSARRASFARRPPIPSASSSGRPPAPTSGGRPSRGLSRATSGRRPRSASSRLIESASRRRRVSDPPAG
jgi:hypothetical protein